MDDRTFTCHVQRMKYYDSVSSVMQQEEVLEQFINDRCKFEVSKFSGCRWSEDLDEYQLLVN